jgi:hypothetical protein
VGLALAAAIWLAFVNAVRGANALRRFKREEAAAPPVTEVA